MDALINSGNLDALKVFTLDDDNNLVTATWSYVDGVISIEKNGAMDFRTSLQSYIMPYEYLLYFYMDSNEKEFSEKLAEEVLNTEIVIAVQDNVTTTKTVDETKEKQEASISSYSYEDRTVNTSTSIMEVCTPRIEITYVDAWCVKYYKENTYSKEELGLGDGEDERIMNISGTATRSTSTGGTPYTETSSGTASTGQRDENGNEITYTYTKYQKVDTTIDTLDIQYNAGTGKTKGNENKFVKAYQETKMYDWQYHRMFKFFLLLEQNEKTNNLLKLTKYLIYKATSESYGVIEYNFDDVFGIQELIIIGGVDGDYIVHIDKSPQEIVITDLATLKKAFRGYSASQKLVEHAEEFLELQNKYRVNAVFAAAVSISETGAGRAGHAVDGKNNWFNIECRHGKSHGRFETYSSAKESIEAFYQQISIKNYYFTAGKYTVREIGMTYCENADAPGGWIENTTTFMGQMFRAAGINSMTGATGAETETGARIIQIARTKLGCRYVWGATGPNTFDCSGFTQWTYKQLGINIPRTSGAQMSGAKRKVSVSQARVGDILWKSGHVGMYIGDNKYIHAPHTGDVIKISGNARGTFTYALQYY